MVETKEEYVKRMLKNVDVKLVNEKWEKFSSKYKSKYNKKPSFWIDFMDLDQADLTDMDIYSSEDNRFYKFVVGGDDGKTLRILNEEIFDKWKKLIGGYIPDQMQFEIEAPPGTGKSTVMLALGYSYYPKFSVDCVYYMKQDLLNFIKCNPDFVKKNLVCLDEDVKDKGVGSRRSEEDLGQIIESCRKAEVSFGRCRAVAKHENQTVRYRFTVICKNIKRRITCCAVYRHDFCIGLIVVRIPYTKEFFELEYDYNLKKDAFIDSTLQQTNMGKINIGECADIILKDISMQNLNKVGKKEIKLFVYKKYNNLTIMEQSLIETEVFLKLQGVM